MNSQDATIAILEKQHTSVIKAKQELITIASYDEAILFRELEKSIKTRLIDLKKKQVVKQLLFTDSDTSKTINKDIRFAQTAFNLLNNIEVPIYTNKIAIAILSRLNEITDVILALEVNLEEVRTSLEKIIPNDFIASNSNNQISHKSLKAIKTSFHEAVLWNKNQVTIPVLFLSIIRNENDETTKCLNIFGISYGIFKK